MHQIVNVEVDRLQIARKLRRPVEVAHDDVECQDPRGAQRLFCRARRLVEVSADEDQRVLLELASARRPFLDDCRNVSAACRCRGSVPAYSGALCRWPAAVQHHRLRGRNGQRLAHRQRPRMSAERRRPSFCSARRFDLVSSSGTPLLSAETSCWGSQLLWCSDLGRIHRSQGLSSPGVRRVADCPMVQHRVPRQIV